MIMEETGPGEALGGFCTRRHGIALARRLAENAALVPEEGVWDIHDGCHGPLPARAFATSTSVISIGVTTVGYRISDASCCLSRSQRSS